MAQVDELQKKIKHYDDYYDNLYRAADKFLYDYDLASFRNQRDVDILKYGKDDRLNPLLYDEDGNLQSDSWITKFLKSNYNKFVSNVFGASDKWQFDIIDKGRRVSSLNKNYDKLFPGSFDEMSGDELIDYFKYTPEDKNAEGLIYTYRQYDGRDENGNPIYNYKVGYSKSSAWDRLRGQFAEQGIELLSEKRISGAKDWEKAFHTKFINDILIDKGNNYKSGFKYLNGYTEFYNKDLLGADIGQTTQDTFEEKEKSFKRGLEYYDRHKGSDDYELLKAFVYGLGGVAYGIGDFTLSAIGELGNLIGLDNTLSDNIFDRLEEELPKDLNYDRQKLTETLTETVNAFKRGDYFDALFGDLYNKGLFVAETLPELALFGVGFGEARTAKRLYDLKTKLATLNKAKDASKYSTLEKLIAKTESKLSPSAKQWTDYTVFDKVAGSISKDFGFNAIWAKNTNNVIEQRIQNGDDNITIGEAAAIAASQYISTALDRFTFNDIISTPKILSSFKEAINIGGDTAKKTLLGKIASKVGTTAVAMGEEAAQEYAQGWSEIFGSQLGVDGKTIYDVATNQKNLDDALGGALIGATSGGILHTTALGLKYGYENAIKGVDKLKEYVVGKADEIRQSPTYKASETAKLAENSYKLAKHIFNIKAEEVEKRYEILNRIKDMASEASKRLGKDSKIKIYSNVLKTIMEAKEPATAKLTLLSKLLKDDELSKIEKEYLFDKFAHDAVEDVKYEIQSIFGSSIDENQDKLTTEKMLGSKSSSIKIDENTNPVKNNLQHIIDSLEIAKKKAQEEGVSTKKLDDAIKVVKAYHEADTIKKAMDTVAAEVETIGFISEDGNITKPSVDTYRYNLETNILLDRTDFADLDSFHNWTAQRENYNTKQKGSYKLAAVTSKENIMLKNLATSILAKHKDNLSKEQIEKLEESIKNLNEATINNINSSLEFYRGGKKFDGFMTENEEKNVLNKIKQAKDATEANVVVLNMKNAFSSPDIATEFINEFKDKLLKNNSKQITKLDAINVFNSVIDGAYDSSDVKKAIDSKQLSSEKEEYLKHVLITEKEFKVDKAYIKNIDNAKKILDETEDLNTLKNYYNGIVKSSRMSFDDFVDLF